MTSGGWQADPRLTMKDRDPTNGVRAKPVPFTVNTPPPGENRHFEGAFKGYPEDQLENKAVDVGVPQPEEPNEEAPDFLELVREAETQASMYLAQINRRAWTQSLRAARNQHPVGSVYTKTEWKYRSRIFRPKTRTALRKDAAAVAASLFGNIDAINCLPGNESDARQRANAALMEQIINYRTDRSSGKAAMPWFLTAMGARQDAMIAGVCLSKQYWKLELRKRETEIVTILGKDGVEKKAERDVYEPDIDRPDVMLVPPENYIIDPAADWTNPAQTAQYIIIKYPMRMDEIRRKMEHPINPWNEIDEDILRTSAETTRFDSSAVRRAREGSLDRMDDASTGTREFQVIWVYECFMRVAGEDWTFFSIGDKDYLTEPRPVREVYPEQFGERPLSLGYGSLESHRIFPMAPVESWQQHQVELNDIVNLALDALKQNIMPVTKVVRGKNVDLDQIKRRSAGSSIMVQSKDDVTWEQPPTFPQAVQVMTRDLELELDDLAGQFNGQTTEGNNALSRTLGGLKLVAGSANAVQEYDIRVWIETWAAPALAQLVRLEQYYESDHVVLGLCGERAQLFKKYGVNQVDNDLMEQEIQVRVSVGLGAGDPQQRMQKFAAAVGILLPLLQSAPDFTSGKREVDVEAICQEVFGSAGYRDGGARFFKEGAPKENPAGDLMMQKLAAEIEKAKKQGNAVMLQALAALAKVALGKREQEEAAANNIISQQMEALRMGFDHAYKQGDQQLAAMDAGHRHGLGINQHETEKKARQMEIEATLREAAAMATDGGAGGGMMPPGAPGAAPAPPAAPPMPSPAALGGMGPTPGEAPPDADSAPRPAFIMSEAARQPAPTIDAQPGAMQAEVENLRHPEVGMEIEFVRHPATGRITGFRQIRGAPLRPKLPAAISPQPASSAPAVPLALPQ